jgi:hypothetical protein
MTYFPDGGSQAEPEPSKLLKLAELMRAYVESAAWHANAVLARFLGRLGGRYSPEGAAFRRLPLHIGQLSGKTFEALCAAIAEAPVAAFSPSDHSPGYVFPKGDAEMASIFNAGYQFRRLDAPQARAIARALDELAPEIGRRLATGWRVINLKSWAIRIDTVQRGPNAWHRDGFPVGTYKLMIYLTPIGATVGTTEVRLADGSSRTVEGPPGTYLLFDPSVLWHRGVAPSDPGVQRTHVEITIMCAAVTDRRLAVGGLNSSYPRLPWSRRIVPNS